ncbi:hypothetical protein HD600_002487 [Microbacterium ginsengiterrae]|uniref:Uncharacterized protein n=1 Tax=Microbacterium ginsengiterrae TaxID=546115 RepID=A0A7W9CE66_9MICO|nr:hypothetical protein [Microbacterium ginsengiterrae]
MSDAYAPTTLTRFTSSLRDLLRPRRRRRSTWIAL